jgi:hypothetical protein
MPRVSVPRRRGDEPPPVSVNACADGRSPQARRPSGRKVAGLAVVAVAPENLYNLRLVIENFPSEPG